MSSAPPPILLKPLEASHAALLQGVYDQSAEFFSQSTSQPASLRLAAQDLATTAEDEARHILGIFLNNELVGMIDLRFGESDSLDTSLGLILLIPAFRRQGLGGWALRILEAWLRRDTPVEALSLSLPAANHDAQQFFTVHGYQFTGQSTRILAGDTRIRLLQMRKSLV